MRLPGLVANTFDQIARFLDFEQDLNAIESFRSVLESVES